TGRDPRLSRARGQALAPRMGGAIRSVDTNHIVFVERPIAVAGNFNSDADMNLFTLTDSNVAYEFHFYDPTDYTFQLQPWNNTPDGGAYPDPTKIAGVPGELITRAPFDARTAPGGTSDWTHYDGTRITATGTDIVAGKPTLVGQAIGTGTIAFDDLTINEYDAAGTFTREVEHIYPTGASGWYFWSANSVGTGATVSSCKTSTTCLSITGTTDDASWG